MLTATTIAELRTEVRRARQAGSVIGCVPTMGALHAGHRSLIEQAAQQTDFVVVTIFVNPTQFGPGEDFEQYPRPLTDDLQICQDAGAGLVFHPPAQEIYPVPSQVTVTVGELGRLWEGASRPGHFDGVATVVAKLLGMTQPDQAFFGAKDFQQQAIIRAICRDLNLPVDVVTCPTVRDDDGLALSSRNRYLSQTERATALELNRTLQSGAKMLADGTVGVPEIASDLQERLDSEPGLQLDYVAIVDPVTLDPVERRQSEMVILVAAKVGTTRLIDNWPVSLPQ